MVARSKAGRVEAPTVTIEDVRDDPDVRLAALRRTRDRALADGGGGPWDPKTTRGFRFFVCRIMRFDGTRGLTAAQVTAMREYEAKHGFGSSKIRSKDPDFTDPAYDDVFGWFEAMREGGDGLFLMSRWTGKSTLISLWILWMVLRDPNVAFLLVAYTETVGTGFIEKMIRPWMTGRDGGYLQEVFGCAPEGESVADLPPESVWGKWGRSTEIMAPRRTTTRRDPTIRIRGHDQDFTGFHPDWVIYEDIENLVTTSTKGAKSALKTSWRASEFLMPRGRIGSGTTWADDGVWMDIIRKEERRLKNGRPSECRILRLPCRVARKVTVRDEGGAELVRDEYDDSCAPRFRHLTDAKLRRLKSGEDLMGEDDAPSGTKMFAAQMDLNPMPSDAMLFTEAMFRPYVWKPEDVFVEGDKANGLKPHFTVCYFADLAGSSGESKDRSAHLVVAVDPRRHFYIIEACAGRFMPDANLRLMADWYHRYHALYVGIEGGVLRTIYEPLARDWNQRFPSRSFALRKVENGGSRGSSNDRALRIRNYAERGEIHLGPGMTELLEELLRYSGVDNTRDDYVAALAIAVRNIVPGDAPVEDERPRSYQVEMLEDMDRRCLEKAEEAWEARAFVGSFGE